MVFFFGRRQHGFLLSYLTKHTTILSPVPTTHADRAPMSSTPSKIAGRVFDALSESDTNTGAICGYACTPAMVQSLVTRVLQKYPTMLNGWVLLTTDERVAYWKTVFPSPSPPSSPAILQTNTSGDTSNTSPATPAAVTTTTTPPAAAAAAAAVPPPLMFTFRTIGSLRAFRSKTTLSPERWFLVVEHAECLLPMHRYAQPLVSQFHRPVLFTQQADLPDLCTLLRMANGTTVAKPVSAALNTPPKDIHTAFVAPATRWLWHFVLVLLVLANLRRVTHLFRTRRAGGARRVPVRRSQAHARRSRAAAVRKTRRRVGGVGGRSPERRDANEDAQLSSLWNWLTGNGSWFPSVSGVVKALLEFAVNLIPNVLEGVTDFSQDFLRKNKSSIRRFNRKLVNTVGKVVEGVEQKTGKTARAARKALYHTRVTTHLRQSFQSLTATAQTLFRFDTDTARYAVGCLAVWVAVWVISVAARFRVAGGLTGQWTGIDQKALRAFVKHIVLPPKSSSENTTPPDRVIHAVPMPPTMNWSTNLTETARLLHRKQSSTRVGDYEGALRALSESSLKGVDQEYLEKCVTANIRHGYTGQLVRQKYASAQTVYVMVVVPEELVSSRINHMTIHGVHLQRLNTWEGWRTPTPSKSKDRATSKEPDRVYVYTSVETLLTMLPKKPEVVLPAHEIHYLVPPSHTTHAFVWSLFGSSDIERDSSTLFTVPFFDSYSVVQTNRTLRPTTVFEYTRTYASLFGAVFTPSALARLFGHHLKSGTATLYTPDELLRRIREQKYAGWTTVCKLVSDTSRLAETEPLTPTEPLTQSEPVTLEVYLEKYNSTRALLMDILQSSHSQAQLTLEQQLGMAQDTVEKLKDELRGRRQLSAWNTVDGKEKQRRVQLLMDHLREFKPFGSP